MKRVSSMPTKGVPYLDYEQLFDGSPWKLEKADFGGRDEKMVAAAIRNAAYRERIRVSVVARDNGIYVQADRDKAPKQIAKKGER